jgi:hypothetical protein
LTEVSAQLGFAAPSAFSRWHAVSTGISAAGRRANSPGHPMGHRDAAIVRVNRPPADDQA